MNENCIFCKIINNNIPSSKVYEDNKFLAFLDIHPVSKGHTLLIPKQHYEWMIETPDELISDIYKKAKELMIKIKEENNCEYVKLSVIGKDVPHFHIHLIPEYSK